MELETKKIDLSDKLFNIATIFLILIGILVFSNVIYNVQSLPQNAPHQMMVQAEGKAFVVPDIAKASFGVTTEGKDIKEITKTNTDKMNKIIEDIKNAGVKTEDIQTTSFNLAPQYNWTNAGQVFLGYSLQQQVLVKIRDFTKVGEILSLATNDGATEIGSLQFEVDDLDTFYAKARREAIEKAKAKAQSLSQQSGLKLGKLIEVQDNADSITPPVAYSTPFSAVEDSKQTITPQIELGQQEITITAYLTYIVK